MCHNGVCSNRKLPSIHIAGRQIYVASASGQTLRHRADLRPTGAIADQCDTCFSILVLSHIAACGGAANLPLLAIIQGNNNLPDLQRDWQDSGAVWSRSGN